MTRPLSLPVAELVSGSAGRHGMKLLAAALKSTGDPVPAQIVHQLARSPSPTPTQQSSLYNEYDSDASDPYVAPKCPVLEASENEFARLLGRRDACIFPDGDNAWKAELSRSLVDGFPEEAQSRRSSVLSLRRADIGGDRAGSVTSLPIACPSSDLSTSPTHSSYFTRNGTGETTTTRTSVMSSRSMAKDDPLPPLPMLSRASSASSRYSSILDSYFSDLSQGPLSVNSSSTASPSETTRPVSLPIASSRLSSISSRSATKQDPLPPLPTEAHRVRDSATSGSSSTASTNANAPSSERDSLSMPASTHSRTSSATSRYSTRSTTKDTPLPLIPQTGTSQQHTRSSSGCSTWSICSTKDTPLPSLPPSPTKPLIQTHQRNSSSSSVLKGLPPIPEGSNMPSTPRPLPRIQTEVSHPRAPSEPTRPIRQTLIKETSTKSAPLDPPVPRGSPAFTKGPPTTVPLLLPYPGLSNRTLKDLKAEKKARRKSTTVPTTHRTVADLRRGIFTRLLRGGQHPQVIAADLEDRAWLEKKHEESLERATRDGERLREYWATVRMPLRNASGGERKTARECRHGRERVEKAKREAEEAERMGEVEDGEVRRRTELREKAAEYAKYS